MMETSKRIDRERRRMKPKARAGWLKCLLDPKTVTSLVRLGKLISHLVLGVIWLHDVIVKVLRE